MNTHITIEAESLVNGIHHGPALSVIMPFNTRVTSKKTITDAFEIATEKLARDLLTFVTYDLAIFLIKKLKTVIKNLNYYTHKNSVAIYISLVDEKVIYLNFKVHAKVGIHEVFAIRDLLRTKRDIKNYLVQLLTEDESNIYEVHSEKITKIVTNTPGLISSDLIKENINVKDEMLLAKLAAITTCKYLQHTDDVLDIILHDELLPVFIIGSEKLLGNFKQITRHPHAVIEYIHGNYRNASQSDVYITIQPYLKNWEIVRHKNILNQIKHAHSIKKLVAGIKGVFNEATSCRGRLLLVEDTYQHLVKKGTAEEHHFKKTGSPSSICSNHDMVDELIERVLENGGDVELVDDGFLESYQHIAMIKY